MAKPRKYPAVTLTRAPAGLSTPLAEVFGASQVRSRSNVVGAESPASARTVRKGTRAGGTGKASAQGATKSTGASTGKGRTANDGYARFEELGLRTVEELLRYYPRRYVTGDTLTGLAHELRAGEEREVIFHARIESGKHIETRKVDKKGRRITFYKAVAVDDAGTRVSMSFFNQPWADRTIGVGTRGYFFGKVSHQPRYGLSLAHPEYHKVSGGDGPETAYASGLLPIYPATARADSWTTGLAILQVLDALREIEDPLPQWVRARHGLCTLAEALQGVHRPRTQAEVHQARRRLRFEEAFVLQSELVRRRTALAQLPAEPRLAATGGLLAQLDERLPFRLTAGQREVAGQIEADLARPHPMHRLLQGDVGSGKTVVALRAMLTVVDSGGQAALLAPTEVLAQQHYRTILELLGPLAERGMLGGSEHATAVALLTGSQSTAQRRRNLLEVASGEAGIVVGTHALLQEKVGFADLGLVVVDEQHRFGVEQRATLSTKNSELPPHVLVMTATPIPRTVAMTVFGDLEVSTLRERPSGRAGTSTVVVDYQKPSWADRVWQRVAEEVSNGRQVYVVCPRIDNEEQDVTAEEMAAPEDSTVPEFRRSAGPESDDEPPRQHTPDEAASAGQAEADLLDARELFMTRRRDGVPQPFLATQQPEQEPAKPEWTERMATGWAVHQTVDWLRDGPLAGVRLGALHGRMPGPDKDAVMRGFAAGEIDVLVSTTVIEVGVDVPNASTMVILDADWFGVSQLHQLRGRIGRGEHPGLCLLVHRGAEGETLQRLDAVASTTDGFELSVLDLRQRREGDILGASQHGFRSTLKLLRVVDHRDLIEQARQDAIELAEADPSFAAHPELVRAVDVLFGESRAGFLEKS